MKSFVLLSCLFALSICNTVHYHYHFASSTAHDGAWCKSKCYVTNFKSETRNACLKGCEAADAAEKADPLLKELNSCNNKCKLTFWKLSKCKEECQAKFNQAKSQRKL